MTTDQNGNQVPIFSDIFEDESEGLFINQTDLLSAYQDVDNDMLFVNNFALTDPTSGTVVKSESGDYKFVQAITSMG